MTKHDCHCDNGKVVNALVDLNGVPYLLAEYLEKNTFQQIDRSWIKSGVFIDQHEAMRAIIDINIDDIGRRGSDGLPAVRGNNTKQRDLLESIMCWRDRFDNQLPTFRRGIVLRVNYQVENKLTGRVTRSMVEDFKILDRTYYLDINPRDVDDNAIIANLSGTFVSTVNEYGNGRDRLVLRITNVQMLYECCKNSPKMPYVDQSIMGHEFDRLPFDTCGDPNLYQYHQQMQHHHQIGTPGDCGYGHEHVSAIAPPTWTAFNRFYHFDNNRADIIIHGQEVNDPNLNTVLIPCGTVQVNRTFVINPAHRLVFRFSIWKNDVVVVSNAVAIANALKVQLLNNCGLPEHDPDFCNCGDHTIENPDYHKIMHMLRESREMECKQNRVINQLINKVDEMCDLINHRGDIEPIDPETPDDTSPDTSPDADIDPDSKPDPDETENGEPSSPGTDPTDADDSTSGDE